MNYIFDSLLATSGCEAVSATTFEAFIGASGPRALFLTGDTTQRPEAGDVAVVLRELLRGNNAAHVRLGIVDRRDEMSVMQRLGVVVLPAVVLIRDGVVQETVARMRDWQVYSQAFARLAVPARDDVSRA